MPPVSSILATPVQIVSDRVALEATGIEFIDENGSGVRLRCWAHDQRVWTTTPPSSSEVAAMIEGVLRHCTDMDVQKTYVDSHGQSDVAFAFCHLLGFHLLPRLKHIHAQRLYRPIADEPDA